jgi:hypothetical protein
MMEIFDMSAPNTSEVSWLALVLEADKDHYKADDSYEFSNGRKFESTDGKDKGIYGPQT